MPSDSRLSTTDELNFLRQRVDQLERRNTELSSELSRLHERTQEAEGYRFLFENMEEGFCIIQFIDGPLGPLSDYVHLMANPAYCRHAGLPDVVGRTLREVIPDEAEVWLDYFGTVERTGKPLYFEHELLATERCLGLAAIRIEPAHNHQVAVIFRDVTARKRAESALQHLNAELEQRVELAVAQSQKAEEALRQAQKVEAVGQLTGASRTTSTTCSAASSALWNWPETGLQPTSAKQRSARCSTAPTVLRNGQRRLCIGYWRSPGSKPCNLARRMSPSWSAACWT